MGALGTLLVLGGLLLVPLPGPGWLIVLVGLTVLASEFAWAARLQRFVRRALSAWVTWLAGCHPVVRLLIGSITLLVVVAVVVVVYLLLRQVSASEWLPDGLLSRLSQ